MERIKFPIKSNCYASRVWETRTWPSSQSRREDSGNYPILKSYRYDEIFLFSVPKLSKTLNSKESDMNCLEKPLVDCFIRTNHSLQIANQKTSK